MVEISASGPTTMLISARGPDREPILSVLAKRTYRLEREGRCALADDQLPLRLMPLFDPDRGNLLIADVETYPFKVASDVVVRGHVYASGSASRIRAEVRVGTHAKLVDAVGDRRCGYSVGGRVRISEPERFDRIPLEYDRAYGGRDRAAERRHGHPWAALAPYVHEDTDLDAYSPYIYPRNRHGRGYLVEATADAVEGLLLPNLEDPAEPLRPERIATGDPLAWHEMPLPACTTWVPPSYFGRGALLGMRPLFRRLPDTLAEFERGWLPREAREIDASAGHPLMLRYTNGASLGLQVPYLRPSDRIRLVHLHRSAPQLEIVLPDDVPHIAADGRNGTLKPAEPVIHHVEIEPDEARLTIVWRGCIPALRPYLPKELETMPFRVVWRNR